MAITCQQAEEQIEQRLEGMLPLRQERLLQRHLAECARCAQRYRREKKAVEALHTLASVEVPPGLVERVMGALPNISPRLLGRMAGALRRAAVDPDFCQRLRENPTAALLSMHIALPPGLHVEIVPQQTAPLPTPEIIYLPLPELPLEIAEMDRRLAAMGLGALFGLWW